jgi:TPR repeat protein
MNRTSFAAALVAVVALAGCTSPPETSGRYTAAEAGTSAANRGRAEQEFQQGMRFQAARNHDRAAQHLQLAANLGHADAQFFVGAASALRGETRSAADWFSRAALQGQREAQFALGKAYAEGKGVPKEPAWAAMWFNRAAERGHARAQLAFALERIEGKDTARDFADAYRWLALAERQGLREAFRYRAALAAKLSTEERGRAAALIAATRFAGGVSGRDAPLIRFVQFALARQGHDAGPPTGAHNAATEAAIRAFAAKERINAADPYGAEAVQALRRKLR